VVLSAAAFEELWFVERMNVTFVTNTSGIQTADERLRTEAAQAAHRQQLKIPRR